MAKVRGRRQNWETNASQIIVVSKLQSNYTLIRGKIMNFSQVEKSVTRTLALLVPTTVPSHPCFQFPFLIKKINLALPFPLFQRRCVLRIVIFQSPVGFSPQ